MSRSPAKDSSLRATVLVVDDDEASRRAMVRILQAARFRVVEAAGPIQALEVLAAAGVKVGLLVTDINMPGGSGDELAARAWERWPALPVLFVSGSAGREACTQPAGPSKCLVKPVDATRLVAAADALLASTPPVVRPPLLSPLRAKLHRLRRRLPAGRSLPPHEWDRRHRCAVAILWLHVIALSIVGCLVQDAGIVAGAGHGLILAAFAIVAGREWLGQRTRQLVVAAGLLMSSALIVHLSNGAIEAHFHYFLVVGLLSLYEDWLLFMAAFGFVLGQHAVMSAVEPDMVFAHGGNPWKWSVVHGGAIAGMGAICVLTWRLNEDVRDAASRARSKLAFRALHDELTGLPNRRMLLEELDVDFARSAVVLVDLDNLKLINDSHGRAAGDRLLIDAAARISAAVRDTHFVARSVGDEFVVVLQPIVDEADALAAADRVLASFAVPFTVAGAQRRISVSAGVARCDPVGDTIVEALARAEAALHHAKAGGRGRAYLADDDVLRQARRRTSIEDALDDCNAADFDVHYQPIVDLRDGSLHAVEALMRWTHPTLGAIAPLEFIELAERGGRILDLGRWVLERACRDAIRWEQLRGAPVKVFVNVSASQITHPNFAQTVLETIEGIGAGRGHIALEITETAALDHTLAVANLDTLRRAGIDLVLDDFGVGYASLDHVADLPVSLLKLDRSFVTDPGDPRRAAILGAVVELAAGLGIPALAEGIETACHLHTVRTAGFALAQGFLFSRPVPAAGLDAVVIDKNPFGEWLTGPLEIAAAEA